MTLLVGIRCKDGVIIAADRAVTFSAGDAVTISHSAKKVTVIKDQVIIAGTGAVGMKQRFCESAEKSWTADIANKGKTPIEAARILCAAGMNDFRATGMNPGTFGALVAFPSTKGGPQLCEFEVKNFQPELKDAGSWFVSMGSGQSLADPYLAFMRDAFWQNGMPTIKHGLFAAAWVMRQSIRAAPGYVAEPIDIAVLVGSAAKMLSVAEVQYQLDAADQATAHFGTFDPTNLPAATASHEKDAPPMPEPPTQESPKG